MLKRDKIPLSFVQTGLLLVILMEAQFFYILPLPSIFWFGHNSDNKSYVIMLLYLLIFYLFLKNNFKIGRSEYFSFIKPYLIFQVIAAAMLIVRSKYLYSQSWFSMTQCADYLFMPITAIVFMTAFKGGLNFRKMMIILFWVVFICQIVIFLQGITYFSTGVIFCRGMRESGTIGVRNGMLRSARNALNFIGIGYAMNSLLNNYNSGIPKIYLQLMLIISTINLLFFNGYRTLILATFVMLIAIMLFSHKLGKSVKLLLLVGLFVVFFAFGGIDMIFQFFSAEGEYSGSNATRFASYEFYWNRFADNPLFGFGLIRPFNSRTIYLFGGTNRYYVTDAAAIGLLSEVGILGALTYVVLFIRGLYIVRKVKGNCIRPLLIGILVYIVATAPGLIITNISRSLAIPVCMAIFESIYFEYKNNAVKNREQINNARNGEYV